MAAYYQTIAELAANTTRDIATSVQNWTAYLDTAAQLYKYPFQEQILIYAQRPNATACAPIELWNKRMHRWVNRGTSGIALIDETGKRPSLKYVFDVADTHAADERTPPPYMWAMREEYEEEVSEALTAAFGEVSEDSSDFAFLIGDIVANAVLDNLDDYLADFLPARQDSLMAELDEHSAEVSFRQLVELSVAYCVMARCGLDAEAYLYHNDLTALAECNTPETIFCLGSAVSDISETILRQVERAVKSIEKRVLLEQPEKFASLPTIGYDKAAEELIKGGDAERSGEHGTEVQADGRISGARPDAGGERGDLRQVRDAASDLLKGAPARDVQRPAGTEQADTPSGGDRQDGEGAGGADDGGHERGSRLDGGTESQRPDGLDGTHERLEKSGRGNRTGRADLQVNSGETAADEISAAVFMSEKLPQILRHSDDFRMNKDEIVSYFLEHPGVYERAGFLRDKVYQSRRTEFLEDGDSAYPHYLGYRVQEKGLDVWEGKYPSTSAHISMPWDEVAVRVGRLIEAHDYLDQPKVLPTVAEQKAVIQDKQGGTPGQLSMFDTVEDPTSAEDRGLTLDVLFPIAPLPQSVIDAVLRCGGNRKNSVLRICASYMENKSDAENITFLHREFDQGGRGIVVDGKPYAVWYGEDGLHIAAGREVQYQMRATIVTWEQMDASIGELLKNGMYAPQADLDGAMPNEYAECAQTLCYLQSDTLGHFFKPALFAGGYPDRSDRVAAVLADPEQLSAIVNGLTELIEAAAQGEDVLRFYYHRPKLLLERLTNLQQERRTFTEAPAFLPTTPKLFITEDEINDEMRRGGTTEDEEYRIYSYVLQGHSGKDLADYLKQEYGVGGHNPALNADNGSEWHDPKGIKLERGDCEIVFLTWANVAQRVTALVRAGRYMSAEALEKIPDYEKGVLANEIYHFYSRLPPEIPRPFPAGFDYYDGIKVTRPLLDDPATVADTVAGMEQAMVSLSTEDREHDYRQRVLRNLTAYRDGTFSLFSKGSQPAPPAHPKRVRPAPKAQLSMDTPPYEDAPLPESMLLPDYTAWVLSRAMGDEAYINARNNADEDNARIECDIAVDKALLALMGVDMEAYASYADSPMRSTELKDYVFKKSYLDFKRKFGVGGLDVLKEKLYAQSEPPAGGATGPGEEKAEAPAPFPITPQEWARIHPDYKSETDEQKSIMYNNALIPIVIDQEHGHTMMKYRFEVEGEGVRRSVLAYTEDEAQRIMLLDGIDPASVSALVGEMLYGQGYIPAAATWMWGEGASLKVMDEYDGYKRKYPKHTIALQVGDYAYLFEGDAEKAAPLMGTRLLSVSFPGISNLSVTGFPVDSWVSHVEKLCGRGHNILVVGEDEAGDRYVIKERLAADYIRVRGIITIDDRKFMVDSVDFANGEVSLRDEEMYARRYPIFRTESIEFVRALWEEQCLNEDNAHLYQNTEPPAEERHSAHQESGVNFPGEIIVVQDKIAQNFHITDDDLGVGGPKAKFAANIAAIETLQRLERQKRNATPEEQDTLSRYVGWGGISEAFDERNEKWAKEYEQLKSLLTGEEYAAARASVLNAHYTSPTVIKAIYQCVGSMGFHMGNILEPAMGVGNFFGLVPEEMAGSKLYGAELDPITGRIAQKLYPLARIEVKGFEKTAWPDSFFDVAVGNVPFGAYSVQDPKYDKLGFHIHDYFFAKTIDQVRPGGVVAFVTSRFTMDKKNSTVRKYLAQRCDLLGAIRLPNNAFKANAGTEVTADILFLQKRDRPIEVEPGWVQVRKSGDDLTVNQYFLDHPEMVLGELVREQRLYGSEDLVCKPFPDSDLSELLARAIPNIHGSISVLEQSTELEENETQGTIPADPEVRNFSYALVNDKLYFRENSTMNLADTTKTGESRIRGMIGVRDAVRALIDAQMDGCNDDSLHHLQAKLNTLYDRYTSKYGLLNSRGNDMAFSDDSSYPLLCALEILDEDGNLKAKADMFTKRTIRQESTVTHADTAVEALGISIGDRACVDLGFMSVLMGHPGEVEPIIEALRGVIFRNPTAGDDPLAGWQAADEYLSGNVRLKLDIAEQWAEREPGRYDSNVEALTLAQPRDLEASEIGVRLGATWIPTEDYQQFVFDLMGTPMSNRRSIKVLYAGVNGLWNISGKYEDRGNKASVTYGTKRISGYELIETSLNLKDVRIFDTVTENGSEKRVLNRKETILAQQKQHAIQQAFKDWVWSDPERRDRLAARYNELFNDTRPREFNGSHIRFVGMNPEIKLRKHQEDAVARILYGGNALLAHVVGAGKTWTMAAAAMEGKRLGLCQKSLFVVPSHLTEQWGAEFLQLYPSANILVATKKDFEKANRKKFCGRIATGDYDAIIIGHSQFEKIPMSPERQEEQLNRQISEMENGIAQVKADRGEKFTIKQMEYTRKTLEEKLKKLTSTTRKDDLITFEELGVDRLFVDEAHYYKNLFLYTKMRNVAGISQTEAQKSSDLYMKCLFMDERTALRHGGPGRGVIFATGTPISNSMTELYTMMRYLQNDMLERKSLTFFDSWASTFGETVTALELAPEGTGYRLKTRFARFYNLPELMNLWKEVTDVQTADMLQLPVPKANYHTEVVKPTELQREMVKALGARAEEIRKGNVDPSVDNMLKITNDGRNLALDQRQMNHAFQDDPGSKVNDCIQKILDIWEGTSEHHSAQMVFCDLSTPKHQVTDIRTVGGVETVVAPPFSVYYDIKDKLVNRGVPEQEIAFIHDANTDARKAELFAKVRAGQVRVLLGSTAKMGAGTNAQKRLAALHHLDVPWRPSDIEQREGRILRQGNENEEVDIFRYVTEGTFDAYSWVRHEVA